ncbi:hypothetical protein M1349_02075 [Patescibacteria group bacterium]|nr:hypothetical protein [Patescibacteria group bacterium]
MLSKEAIDEFRGIYYKEYGQRLTDKEALELGTRLINFVKSVYGNNLPELKAIDTGVKEENN